MAGEAAAEMLDQKLRQQGDEDVLSMDELVEMLLRDVSVIPTTEEATMAAAAAAITSAHALPGDAFEEILRRVPPRGLAACRSVCASWRAAVDAGRLLRADRLPLSVAGILIHFDVHNYTEMFVRPASSSWPPRPEVSARLDFLPSADDAWTTVCDHCNGLLLLEDYVVNPATRRWDPLPRPPRKEPFRFESWTRYLAYDPTMSPHYEVVRIRTSRSIDIIGDLEWPPSPFVMQVFSSRTRRWEERPFSRQGSAAGTFTYMDLVGARGGHAAFWRGKLYVHCANNFFLRISLSSDEYQVIQPPTGVDKSSRVSSLYLGKSEKGVYLASLNRCDLRVWILDESSPDHRPEWVLKHHNNLENVRPRNSPYHYQHNDPWRLEDVNYNQAPEIAKSHWKFLSESYSYVVDDPAAVIRVDRTTKCYVKNLQILGFHPFAEIVFLSGSSRSGLSYRLDRSELRYLGSIFPTCCGEKIASGRGSIVTSFPYTPCWIKEIPANK
ncbi:hypothetical protein EJB05_10043, partial [Eragrostis curvula]